VHDHNVTLASEFEQLLQLRSVRISTRRSVGEGAIQHEAIKLTVGDLLNGAHSDVSDALSGHATFSCVDVALCQDDI
jgi:hypothetical protein